MMTTLFIVTSNAVNLPYEVETTLLDLLAKKYIKNLDTSKQAVVPLYRKDLDPNYIAYYEISYHGKYVVLSTGPKTGDHPVAESGRGPLPTKVLRDKARSVGQQCKKFFVLTSMGLYMCENENGTAVAATYNWISNAPVSIQLLCAIALLRYDVNIKTSKFYYFTQGIIVVLPGTKQRKFTENRFRN